MTTNKLIIILLTIISFSKCQFLIKNIYFLPKSNLITDESPQRDGIVVVTLNTGSITTICNYKFSEVQANIVCKTLGFPPQGVSIINTNSSISGPVLLANVQCTGSEVNISYCTSSGLAVQPPPCSAHTMDVHVYCTNQKIPPVVEPNDVNTNCTSNKVDGYQIITSNNAKNFGILQYYDKYVCNDDFSFDSSTALYICNKLCSNPNNPSVIMPIYTNQTDLTSVKCLSTGCNNITIQCFKISYFVGIKCGEEPQFIEKGPNVTCSNLNMSVTWNAGFLPYISPNLTRLAIPCNESKSAYDNNNNTVLSLAFNSCPATVTGDRNSIYFTYQLIRSYLPQGISITPDKTLSVYCSFPKDDKPINNFTYGTFNDTLLRGTTKLQVNMTFYSDNGYLKEIKPPGLVDSDKPLYVKVNIYNPPKNVSLSLIKCSATTANDSRSLTSSNSVVLIDNVCPVSVYDVIISPFNRSEVRFQFKPFKITSNPNTPIYILCNTGICHLDKDEFCALCKSRKKRSLNRIIQVRKVQGMFYLK